MNNFKLLAALGLSLSLAACSGTTSETSSSGESTTESTAETTAATSLDGTYSIHVDGYDWGPAVTKATITLEEPVDAVNKDTFTVEETKQAADYENATDEGTPIIESTSQREVTDAYLSDAQGNKVDTPSQYVTLELGYDPDTGSPLLWDPNTFYNIWSDPYYLSFTVKEDAELTSEGNKVETVNIEQEFTSKTTSADSFSLDEYTAEDGTTYNYALFEPEEKSDTLVVWLHGMGEGGTLITGDASDPYITLLANEAATLAQDPFQETIGGANVLVPQSPTYWMDFIGDGSGYLTRLEDTINESVYTESLHELIQAVKEETGSDKVIVTGGSNGGFMTVLLAENYPDAYDGYVAIAETLPDSEISDEQIETLKDLPIFFIYSNADTSVDPTTHEIPTIERLIEAGGENIQVYAPDKVIDLSGTYTDEDGNPHEYSGHWSWIYFFNNEAETEEGVPVFTWVADVVNEK